ncbi:hypothetical protein BDV10DRAFT_162121, partial [Aspergillus recurvatus]
MLSTLDVITHFDSTGGISSLRCKNNNDMGVRCHGFELVEGLFGSWLATAAVMGCFESRGRRATEI